MAFINDSFFEELEEEISFGFNDAPKPARPAQDTPTAPVHAARPTQQVSAHPPIDRAPDHARTPAQHQPRREDRPYRENNGRAQQPRPQRTDRPAPAPRPVAVNHPQSAQVSQPAPAPKKIDGGKSEQRGPRGNRSESEHVLQAREQMNTGGVALIVFVADKETRVVLGPIKLETRGLAHLFEAREIHRFIIKTAKACYEQTVMDVPDIEEKDFLKIIKKDLSRMILEKFGRDPMIVPVIINV